MTEGSRRAALVLGDVRARGGCIRNALSAKGVDASLCPLEDYNAREISEAVVGAVEKLGSIDILVYCAGEPCGSRMLLDIDEGEWDGLMNRELKGFFLSCKYALPYLIGREAPRIFLLAEDVPAADACGLHAYTADAAGRAAVAHMSGELAAYGVLVERVAAGEGGERFGPFLSRC